MRRLGIAVSAGPDHPPTLSTAPWSRSAAAAGLRASGAWTAFDAWRQGRGPHESLDLAVTASRYHIMPPALPRELPPLLAYGPEDQIRRVQAGGRVSQGHQVRLPKALRGQSVAFRPTAIDGRWAIASSRTDELDAVDLRPPA